MNCFVSHTHTHNQIENITHIDYMGAQITTTKFNLSQNPKRKKNEEKH